LQRNPRWGGFFYSTSSAKHGVEEMSKKSRQKRDACFADSPYRLYRTRRICELFDVDASTVWRWQRTGVLPPPIQVGGVKGWPEPVIQGLLKQQEATDDRSTSRD
jgi:predicted DNA-binding transcriptional regulator AlpA